MKEGWLIKKYYCSKCEQMVDLPYALNPGKNIKSVLKTLGWVFYPDVQVWVCPKCSTEMKEKNETLKRYRFQSSTEVFACDETEAKDKFAVSSIDFAINAEITEIKDCKTKIDFTTGEIEIEYFYIYNNGDPSVGIPTTTFTLNGPLFFDNKEELEIMRKELQKLFEEIYFGEKIQVWTNIEIEKMNQDEE